MTDTPPNIPAGLSIVGNVTFESYVHHVTPDTWCVYTHSVFDPDAQDGQSLILIDATKLSDLFTFKDARKNSEWEKIVTPQTYLYARVLYIGERLDCQREVWNMLASMPERPRCNLYGYNSQGAQRTICCSNGQEYSSQMAASNALGIAQGNISGVLSGRLKHTKGLTFWYKS